METALIKVLNDTDTGKTLVLVLLDLNAAFDIVEHKILIDSLSKCVESSGTVFSWFISYLERLYVGAIVDRDHYGNYESSQVKFWGL